MVSVSLSGNINYLDCDNPSKPLKVVTGHNKPITALSCKLKTALDLNGFWFILRTGRLGDWETGRLYYCTGLGRGSLLLILSLIHSLASFLISFPQAVGIVCSRAHPTVVWFIGIPLPGTTTSSRAKDTPAKCKCSFPKAKMNSFLSAGTTN